MIQRIQTLYLALGVVALGALPFFDVTWSGPAATSQAWFQPAVFGLLLAAAGTAVGAIFLYADRERQRKVVVAAQLLTFALAAVFYLGLYLSDDLTVQTPRGVDAGRVAALVLPAVGYVFFLLARRAIDRDIDLVQSMDRLR